MLSIVVLGAGSHSRAFHGPALKALRDGEAGRYRLAAVCDLDRARGEAYAADFGFERTYGDLSAMIEAERPGAVVAVTPMEQTLPLASQVLRAGIPVLIEKPPGLDTKEAEPLLAVARETGTGHMVSFNRRFSPAIVKARQWLAERAPSRPVRLLTARMLRHKRREENFVAHTGIHLTDTVLSFTGPPRGVAARKIATSNAASHLYEATLELEGGAVAQLLFASAVGRLAETYDLYGEDYHIRVECLSGTVEAWESGKIVLAWRPAPEDSPVYVNGTLEETREFLAQVECGRPMRPNLEDALASFRVAETIQNAGG
jgi:predicted dehydrogenase